jgi:hypothetical protein
LERLSTKYVGQLKEISMLGFGRTLLHVNAATGFLPTDLSGLSLWLRSDLGISLTSGKVTTWADQSSNGNNFTADTTGVEYTVSGLNGLPILGGTFNSDALFGPAANVIIGGSPVAAQMFMVMHPTASPSGFGTGYGSYNNAFGNLGGQYYSYLDDNFYDDFCGTGTSAGRYSFSVASFLDTWCVYNVISTASNWQAFLNGTQVYGGGLVGPFIVGANSAGMFVSGNSVEVAEVIIYNRALSGSEQTQVINYLSTRYGLSGFDPSRIANCVTWLRSDLGITLNGSNVSGWADQSGQSNNAAQSNATLQPGYVGNGGPNNVPYLNWVGPTDSFCLQISGLTVNQPCEYFVVCQPQTGAGNNYLLDCGGNENLTYTDGSTWNLYSGGSVFGQAITIGQDAIVDSIFNGSSSSITIDNGTPSTGDPGPTGGSGTVTIGGYGGGGSGWSGFIYEVVIYSAPISPTDRNSLLNYFSTRYNITI